VFQHADCAHPLPAHQAFLPALRDRGYAEGLKLVIECRSAKDDQERIPAFGKELAQSSDVVFVATCGEMLNAVRRSTPPVPIVVGACTEDMVESGLAASRAATSPGRRSLCRG
jgi:ABC-type uncharacterized transport system substrate-binding protein